MGFSRRAGAGRLAIFALAFALAACNQTPTEITALPRAIGEIEAVYLQVTSLAQLDGSTEGTYHLWSLAERNSTDPLGPFFIDDNGQMVDANGTPKDKFTANDFSLNKTLSLLVTIELPGAAGDSPSGTQILSGVIIEGVANLNVPISSDLRFASGSLRVFTPTDGPDTNENSGFWYEDAQGNPSLNIPDSTAALEYETFVEIGGQTLIVGRFDFPDQLDSTNRFSADLVPPPQRPGEDLLVSAPEGLTFPTDISGARITISLEGRRNDFVQQGQLVVFEAILPMGLVGGEQIPFVNKTASFPSGRAVLY